MKKRAYIGVRGRVQCVMFRDSTRRRAKKEDVVGYVRNLKDGSVEIVAEGEEEHLLNLINWCRRGSFLSKVLSVNVIWEDYKGEFNKFIIKYD